MPIVVDLLIFLAKFIVPHVQRRVYVVEFQHLRNSTIRVVPIMELDEIENWEVYDGVADVLALRWMMWAWAVRVYSVTEWPGR